MPDRRPLHERLADLRGSAAWAHPVGPERLRKLLHTSMHETQDAPEDAAAVDAGAALLPECAEVREALAEAVRLYRFESGTDLAWERVPRGPRHRERKANKLRRVARELREVRDDPELCGRFASQGLDVERYWTEGGADFAVCAETVAADLEGERHPRGPNPEWARRRLAHRLALVWDECGFQRCQPRPTERKAGPEPVEEWPFSDFLEAVSKPVTGQSGLGYAVDLAALRIL